MERLGPRRMTVLLVALALAGVGLSGAYNYWESYYQHRGFEPVALVAGARRGTLETVNFYSRALHREADYLAYLPPGYAPAQHRYPVYYLLHGSPGRPQVYIAIADMGLRMDNLIAEHRMRPMILIYPDGRIGDSTYSDSEWANTPSGNFENYVINVVHDVDHRFATIATRGARAIAGFSAGAYGATNITLHHLAVFGNLQSWSGYYIETRSGVFAHASRADLDYNSPLDEVAELGPKLAVDPLRAFLFVGRDDNVSPQIQPFAEALASRGAVVNYALYPGGHDWQLWHAHLNQMLELASRDTRRPLRAGAGSARSLTPGVRPIPNGLGRHRRHPRRALARRRLTHIGLPLAPMNSGPTDGRSLIAGLSAPDGDLSPARGTGARPRDRDRASLAVGGLLGGLVLALVSAALINLGFLLQHRGLSGLARPEGAGLASTIRGALRNRTWLSGQLLGWIGFAMQILAVAIAPLSLVQAFAAGGLALSVPLAASVFGHRITRGQLTAVLLIALALAILPIGFSTARDHLRAGTLVSCSVAAGAAGLAVAAVRMTALRAIAAGIFYGVADAAIKAVSLGLHRHGAGAVLSGWTAAAAVATVAGFIAFQSALREDGAVGAISLMTALAALVALICGVLAFGESLGAHAGAVVAHLGAIAVVLGSVPVLAAAQAQLAAAGEPAAGRGASHGPPVLSG